jgi:type IV secretory pathway TraG/TraD family ATPase VirD4
MFLLTIIGLFVASYYRHYIISFIKWIYRFFVKAKEERDFKNQSIPEHALVFKKNGYDLILNNPYRGVLVVGSAGSGKSESIAVPALEQFVKKGYSGVIYDFKFPTLANDVETFTQANQSAIKHYYVNFDGVYHSHKINPIAPEYVPNTSYAREYAQAIIANMMKESIKKPDFWTRSATDILTASIWFLREEHPYMCDIPHLFALLTSKDEDLLKLLQTNPLTEQMTVSIYSAMQRGADAQVSGVIGTLQGAIAQINTPELMHVFSKNEVPLNVNDPENPIILTVGNSPQLSSTLAPLCSLIITVCTKLMNQPNKEKSFLMLDEAPTVFIPNLEVIPNTGRSNKISTVLMCQDLSQLTDGYGKEKADVLFAACNNHFYGRVSSSQTADLLSKQFGKTDITYVTSSSSRSDVGFLGKNSSGESRSESIQEREVIKAADFLRFGVGEFTGLVVESGIPTFRGRFQTVNRNILESKTVALNTEKENHTEYYKKVRENVKLLLSFAKVEG